MRPYVTVAFLLLCILVNCIHISSGHGSHQHNHKHESESHSHSHAHAHSHGHHPKDHTDKSNAERIWMDTLGAVAGVSIAPFVLLFVIPDLNTHHALLKILLGFAAGGLLGDAFLHLIPHGLSHVQGDDDHESHDHSHSLADNNTRVFLWVIGGIFGFLFLDKFLRFFRAGHSHTGSSGGSNAVPKNQQSAEIKVANQSSKKKKSKNAHVMATSGYLNLAADFAHNFTDGIAIAGSFLISRNVGYVTSFAVLIHELPHEIGDYAILIKSGCGAYRAMLLQLVTALGALLGAALSLTAAGVGLDPTAIGLNSEFVVLSPDTIGTCLLPFTAGGFIYIALVSVMPDLLSEHAGDLKTKTPSQRIGQAATEMAAVVLGVTLMAAIGLFE